MPRLLKYLFIAIVLFSVAAGASWYLQGNNSQPDLEKPEKSAKPPVAATRPKGNEPEAPAPRPLLRPPVSPEADRFTQMAATLQAQQESLKNREQHVVVREKQLDLIHDEIKKEQKKLDVVRKEIDVELRMVQEKMDLLERRAGDGLKEKKIVEAQLEEVRQATLEINGLEAKNLKQVAAIYDKMDPEAAAQSIQQMADKGKIDTAVTILSNMRDRQAANLLGEISKQDPAVAVQLFDRMRFLKTPASTGKSP